LGIPVSEFPGFPIYQFTSSLSRIPKPPPRQSHIPVAQLLHEVGDRAGGAGDVVDLQRLGDILHQAVQAGQHPPVHDGTFDHGYPRRGRVEVIQIGVCDEEAIAVPQGQQELADHLLHQVRAETPRVAGRAGGQHVPARGISPVCIQHFPGVDDVAAALGHLTAVLGDDVPQADHILEARAVEQQRAHRVQRVEPAAGLVDGFTDEIGRELLVEQVAVLERVVPLRHRHRPGIEPGVGHLGDAAHGAAALRTRPGQGVHRGPVQVQRFAVLVWVGPLVPLLRQIARVHELAAGFLAQLRDRPHALLVSARRILADPERQRGAPVTLTGQAPIDVVLQPVAEAPALDVVGHPPDLLVVGQELLAERRRLDVPGSPGIVEQRRIAAPAERVGVLVNPLLEHQPALGQLTLDQRVGFLDADAAPGPNRVDEAALWVHGHQGRQVVLLARGQVVGAERGRDVHDAGAVLGADEIAGDGVAVVLIDRQERIQRLVVPSQQIAALDAAQQFGVRQVIAEHRLQPRLGQPQLVVVMLHQDVVDLLTDRHRHVAGQCPRGGGPHQEIGAGLIPQRELDVDAGVLGAFLVTLGQLVAAQWRAATRAVRHDLVTLIDQPAIPELLQDPPERLDVVVGQRAVSRGQVHPVADALRHPLPIFHVVEDALPALAVERRDAVILDGLLAGKAHLFLDLQLHRQAVRVPPALAQDIVTAHRLVAWEDVLEDARQHMMDARPAVGRRRPLVEHIARPIGRLRHRFAEHVRLFPKAENTLLHRGQIYLRRDRLESWHEFTSVSVTSNE